MSLDSSRSYIHLHKPHHADLFEEFTTLQTSTSNTNAGDNPSNSTTAAGATTSHASLLSAPLPGASTAPIHNAQPLGNTPHPFLPAEDIAVPAHYLPPNPEDEDDIVPDQHAAFGITRAMSSAAGARSGASGAAGAGAARSAGGEGAGGERVQRAKERWGEWKDFGSLLERMRGVELEESNAAGAASSGTQASRGAWVRGGAAVRGTRALR